MESNKKLNSEIKMNKFNLFSLDYIPPINNETFSNSQCDNISSNIDMMKNNETNKSHKINQNCKNEKEIIIMNKPQIFDKILSKYIQEGIFDYIHDGDFKFKLFTYSNLFQKRFEINIFDYQEKFFKIRRYDLIKYFSFIYSKIPIKKELIFGEMDCSNTTLELNNILRKFPSNYLKNELEKDFLKLKIGKNSIDNYIKNNFKRLNLKKEFKEILPVKFNDIIQVDIFSPFFDLLSENGLLELCSIIIQTKIIEDWNLKEDYIMAFDKLNKSNYKYSTLTCNFNASDDINYLIEFKINFDNIKQFIYYEDENCGIMNHDYFFQTLFSFEGILNNLVVLDICLIINDFTELIDQSSLENLNNFKSLKTLILENVLLENIFLLKLKNLETLMLINCDIILFDKDIGLNIKKLSIIECSIEKPKSPLKLPEVISFELTSLKEQKSYNIFDFSSMRKLKSIIIDFDDFKYIGNSYLEDIILNPPLKTLYDMPIFLDSEILVFDKIFSIQNLKSLNIPITINTGDITKIINENKSLKKLEIKVINRFDDCILFDLENKFPNLNDLTIYQDFQINEKDINLEIMENKYCKINKLRLRNIIKNTKLYCQTFENLIEIEINLKNEVTKLINVLPIFGSQCQTIFSNLKYFHFSSFKIIISDIDIVKNIYNNMNKMPALYHLELDFSVTKLNEDIYKKIINKKLSLKLQG